MILRVQNVDWILGWVACLIAFIFVFFPSWKTILDTSLTPGYLLSFSTSSYRNHNSFSITRWIDWDFFWTLNSFSTASGSIKLLFSFLLICPSTDPRQLHPSTPFCLTPLDSSICRDLLGSYLSANCDFSLLFLDLSLDRLAFSPPKTLSLPLQISFPSVLQAFSSFSLHLVSFFSLIYMHVMFWNLGFGVFEKFWGFSKTMSFCWNFGMTFCLNEFKISCIASHKHYNSIIMHLDVCKLIVCW